MRVTLIHNPGAGQVGQADAAGLVRLIRAHGHAVLYQSSAAANWEAALDRSGDLVAIAGGDGTVGRSAKALVGRGVPFTVLPMGTANNISKTLGLTASPLARLVEGWRDGRCVPFDVGIAHGPWGGAFFIEAFGAGLFARVLPEADASPTLAALDHGPAKVAYALQMLRDRLDHCAPHFISVSLDGRDLSGEYVLFEAMNMAYVGPNLHLAPDCDLHDGMLDVLLVAATDRAKLEHHLANWQNGILWPAELPVYRGRHVELAWTGFALHIDDRVLAEAGAAGPDTPARISLDVVRDALQFLLPAG